MSICQRLKELGAEVSSCLTDQPQTMDIIPTTSTKSPPEILAPVPVATHPRDLIGPVGWMFFGVAIAAFLILVLTCFCLRTAWKYYGKFGGSHLRSRRRARVSCVQEPANNLPHRLVNDVDLIKFEETIEDTVQVLPATSIFPGIAAAPSASSMLEMTSF